MEAVLNLNVNADRIIYANPCKQLTHLEYAAHNGISVVTFDNADELTKIKHIHPYARYVIPFDSLM